MLHGMVGEQRRIGKWYLRASPNIDASVSEIMRALGFTPLQVNYLAHRAAYEYIGVSRYFDLITLGEEVPEYDLDVVLSSVKVTRRGAA